MRFVDLKLKEIVNVSDGKKIGFADDLIINTDTNEVVALRVPKQTRGFKKPEYFEIPFSSISKIGENVILVDFFDNVSTTIQKNTTSQFMYTPKIFKRSNQ